MLDELAESIKESGLLTPLLVRRIGFEKYQIISGHRRKAALERLGEKQADCDVVEMTDEQAYKALMTANIQSQSLSEIEEAEGILHMMHTYEWTQERVAKEFGKKQNWISYRLSLLSLAEPVKEQIITRVITGTHGREIAQLPIEKQAEVVRQVVEEKLSTRETAELVRQIIVPAAPIHEEYEPDFDEEEEPIPENTMVLVPRQKSESQQFQERIEPGSQFILMLKQAYRDIQASDKIIDSLLEFDRIDETITYIDEIAVMLGMVQKKIENAKYRTAGSPEGRVVEFKRKAE